MAIVTIVIRSNDPVIDERWALDGDRAEIGIGETSARPDQSDVQDWSIGKFPLPVTGVVGLDIAPVCGLDVEREVQRVGVGLKRFQRDGKPPGCGGNGISVTEIGHHLNIGSPLARIVGSVCIHIAESNPEEIGDRIGRRSEVLRGITTGAAPCIADPDFDEILIQDVQPVTEVGGSILNVIIINHQAVVALEGIGGVGDPHSGNVLPREIVVVTGLQKPVRRSHAVKGGMGEVTF